MIRQPMWVGSIQYSEAPDVSQSPLTFAAATPGRPVTGISNGARAFWSSFPNNHSCPRDLNHRCRQSPSNE